MSERSPVLNSQNLHTIVAVAFVLVLLSLGFNFYNFARMNQITAGLLDVEAASIRANAKSEEALQRQITELQTDLKRMKAGAPPAAASAPAVTAAAEDEDKGKAKAP